MVGLNGRRREGRLRNTIGEDEVTENTSDESDNEETDTGNEQEKETSTEEPEQALNGLVNNSVDDALEEDELFTTFARPALSWQEVLEHSRTALRVSSQSASKAKVNTLC